ncbi:MAG: hypothetical protein OXH85_07585 [Truepera sp.]|nr:hypothetical protein [Truepera sp.]
MSAFRLVVFTILFAPWMFLFLLFLFSVFPVLVAVPDEAAMPIMAVLAIGITVTGIRQAEKRNKAKRELAAAKKELAELLKTLPHERPENFESEVQLLTAKVKALEP